jgi:hypothetical protein
MIARTGPFIYLSGDQRDRIPKMERSKIIIELIFELITPHSVLGVRCSLRNFVFVFTGARDGVQTSRRSRRA